MSGKRASFPTTGIQADQAEEFMALLLKAQTDSHECAYCRYFKKLGQKMMESIKEE